MGNFKCYNLFKSFQHVNPFKARYVFLIQMPQGPHIVACKDRLVLVPNTVPIEHVRAAWHAFSQTRLYVIIPASYLIQFDEHGPKEYATTVYNAWTNVAVPFARSWTKWASSILNPFFVVEHFQEQQAEAEAEAEAQALASIENDLDLGITLDLDDANTNQPDKSAIVAHPIEIESTINDLYGTIYAPTEKNIIQELHTDFPNGLNSAHVNVVLPNDTMGCVYALPNLLDVDVNTMDSLIRAEIMSDAQVFSSKTTATKKNTVLIYKRSGCNALYTILIQGSAKADVLAMVRNLDQIGFKNIQIIHAFYLERECLNVDSNTIKALFKTSKTSKAATTGGHGLVDLVRGLYALKKYIEPVPAELNSSMIKFVMTRLFNTTVFDATAETTIDDLWDCVIKPMGSQPQIRVGEFVSVLRYLGHDATKNGYVSGLRITEKDAAHEFFVQRSNKYENVYNRIHSLRMHFDCPRV